MRRLTPDELTVVPGGTGRVVCRFADGREVDDVRCVRLFPLSDPAGPVSLRRKAAGESDELGIVDELAAWPAAQRAILERAIAEHRFLPEIEDVVSIVVRFGIQEWRVRCDRGERSFSVVKPRDNIHRGADGGVLVTDMEQCRYRIPDPDRLTPRARRELEKALP